MSSSEIVPEALSSAKFGRSVVLPLTGLVIGTIVLVIAFVFITARQQDREAKDASLRLAETAIATKKENVARNLKDYAFWQDAFDNLHTKVNVEWAATDGNVGANIYNSLGYELAFVLSPDRHTVYAIQEGKPVTIDAMALMPSIGALLPEAVKGGPATVGFVRSGDDIFIAGASAILPPNAADAPAPEARSIMVFADKLDAKLLDQLSHNYLLSGLRFSPASTADRASLPIVEAGGSSLGFLSWSPDRPGLGVLRSVLPPLGAVLAGLLVFAVLVLRNARRSAAQLQTSAETIKQYALNLQSSEERFRDVAEASSDWIWETDAAFKLTYVSDRIGEVTSLTASDMIGRSLQDFFSTDMATDGWTQLRAMVSNRSSFRDLRCSYADKTGQRRICRLAGRPILDKTGAFIGFRGTAADVTDEVAAQERANHLALHDPLTGLPNRVLLKERLTVALEAVKREKSRVAVLCLDLDHFKDINDTLGHSAGDLLLQQLSHRLQDLTRGMDTVARLGGDEFAIVQVALAQPDDAELLARRLLDACKAPFIVEGSELYIGLSIGIAISPDDGVSQDGLLKHADLALYRAKQAGRGTYRFFEASMDSELQARKAMEQELRRAVVKEELQLHYQPLVSVHGQELKGVEALLRWSHPIRGMVSPAEFIPLAEETGLIVSIGEWVLRTACQQATQWPGILMAVNVSAVQFKHREFVDLVRQILQETGLEPERLELEITEGVLLYDTAAALEILTALKAIGVRIAMDDFGTGYSSLGYLNSFPFDKIKIDRSFIIDVAGKDKSSAIVRSVISLGQSLSMVTIAEGVETSQQLEFLRAEGCDEVQGYFFGKPVPPAELTKVLMKDPEARPFHYDATRMSLLASTAVAPVPTPAPIEIKPQARLGACQGGRKRSAAITPSERRALRQAIEFAHREGKSLNLLLSISTPTGVEAKLCASRWETLERRVTEWFCGQAADGQHADMLFAWARQPDDGEGRQVCHLMLHSPSAEFGNELRRAIRGWCKTSGERISAVRLIWTEEGGKPHCAKLGFVGPLFGFGETSSVLTPKVTIVGPRCGVSPGLERSARAASSTKGQLDATTRQSKAAFREAIERSGTMSLLMQKTLTDMAA